MESTCYKFPGIYVFVYFYCHNLFCFITLSCIGFSRPLSTMLALSRKHNYIIMIHNFNPYDAQCTAAAYVYLEVTKCTGEEQSFTEFNLEPQVNTKRF